MATHSSTLAWTIPWKNEPGRLQSMGSLRVKHDWATSVFLFLSCIGEGNGNPLQCSCLENLRDGEAWWAAVYGVAQSRTWLKRLSSSKGGKKNFIQGKSTTAGSYNGGERLSLSLTTAGTQLGFIAKEKGGCMWLQRETGGLKSNEQQQQQQQQQGGCQWMKTY